jgi:hypothetical protein
MITVQRMSELAFAVSSAAAMASYIPAVSAFFFSGRFIRMVRTGPSSVTMTSVMLMRPETRPT